mgnify:FL=1
MSSTPASVFGAGLSAVEMGGGTVLNNAGTILVEGNARTPAVRTINGRDRVRIVNTGTIDASLGGAGIRGNDSLRLENSGTIRGGAGVAVEISGSDGSSVLLQQGSSIDGAISVRDFAQVPLTEAELGNDPVAIDFCKQNPDESFCNRAVPNLPTTATLQLEGTGSEDDLISGFNFIEVLSDGTWTLDTALQAGSATDRFQTGDFRGPLEIDVQGAGGLLDLTGVISDNPDDGTLAEVEKLGPGTLRLSGTSTSTGVLNLLEGRVDAAGTIPMATVVSPGATVFGTGTLGGIRSEGRVAPGNSIGTLTVTGNYESLPNSILEIELDPTASPKVDLLVVSGNVTAERRMETASGSWKLLGSAHYHYDWLAAEDAFHDITASNPITGTITQVGQNRGAHGLTAGLGISGQLTESIAVGAGYAYGWNEDGEEHARSASFSMTW